MEATRVLILPKLSFRQKRAIDIWLGYGRRSKAEALREAGYSKAIFRQPQKFFDSPAVQAELERRGYGKDGMGYHKKQEETIKATVVPTLDVNKMTSRDVALLKEKLDRTPDYLPPQDQNCPAFDMMTVYGNSTHIL